MRPQWESVLEVVSDHAAHQKYPPGAAVATASRAFQDAELEREGGLTMSIDRRHALKLFGLSALAGALSGRAALAAPVTLADLRKSGVLRVGCEAAYVTFTYRDNKGAIVGFDVDGVQEYVKPLGIKAEFIDTQWSGVIPALYAGRFEMVPTMTYTKERLERVLFSRPYADASQALLIRSGDKDKIKSIADMSGRVLGIKLGSPGETLKTKLDAQLKAERSAGFKDVKTYDDHPAAYLALAQGSVDGVLNTVPTLSVVLRDKPGAYAMVQSVGGSNSHGYAFRKEDGELAEFINGRITEMLKSGQMAQLQEKWFGFKMNIPDQIPTFS
jgi:polar amino acid transport system substrate-binding protein